MERIWSENKVINLTVNVLLFLVGINFLHYGQLILPVICLLLFIDNKLQFKVNSPMTFIVLCLFAVSFYAFSYKMGFYSVMGFTLPMAYYIGSNIKDPSEENIKKIIYLFAISMGIHVILNSIIELILHGTRGFFMSTTHYDFWTREKIANTHTAVNADIIIGCLYYLLFHEKNRKLKGLCLVIFVLSMFYLLVIGRRTPVIMLLMVMVFSFLYEAFILKNSSERLRKNFYIVSLLAVAFVILLILFYSLDLFGLKALLDESHIVHKFKQSFINDQRFELYFGSFALMPKYPWGGQHISTILGEQVHDLLIDIYDYAGIVTCAIMIVYAFCYGRTIYRLFKSKKVSNDLKIFSLGVFLCLVTQMFFEPIMTGSSLFLIIAIIINTIVERLLLNE